MKYDHSALTSALICFVISGIGSYFIFVPNIRISLAIGSIVGLVIYYLVANRKK